MSDSEGQELVSMETKPDPKDEPDAEHKLFQGLDHPLSIDDLIERPNAETLEDVVNVINGGNSPSAVSWALGGLIKPGMIGLIEKNGRIQAVGPGRWIYPHPRSSLKEVVSLDQNKIEVETLTIVRVERGKYGLAVENGRPLLLGEGLHVRNSRLFNFIDARPMNQPYIQHQSLHILRIPKGNYGLITENGVPKLLPEGVHVTNSNVFVFVELKDVNAPYIQHGTIHLLRVPFGQVALVVDNNKPMLVKQGTHYINSKTFTYDGMEELNQQVIRHRTITRFRVLKGELGLAWDDNQPTFFEEGIYERDSPNFIFEKCVNASDKLITLGSKKIITVWDGEVGISFKKGKLVVLRPDKHFIEVVDHIFRGFLSTQQQCLHLAHVDGGGPIHKDKDPDLLYCETKDFVQIGLKADVFYKITNPEKVLLIVGEESIIPLIRETAIATVTSILRSTSLAEVAQNKLPRVVSEKQHLEQISKQPNSPSAPLFFDKVHDEFISKLYDDFVEKYGIEITNIRIESFKISDRELADSISRQVLTTAQTENQLANLAGQTEIATAQMKRDAEVARIKAEGESVRLKTETESKNKATMDIAKAEADAVVIKAEAEAKAILLKAEAEAKRAEMLQKQPLGGELAMFALYSDMVKSSMKGVDKMVYMPTDAMNNPFSFFALQQGGQVPGFSMLKKDHQKK